MIVPICPDGFQHEVYEERTRTGVEIAHSPAYSLFFCMVLFVLYPDKIGAAAATTTTVDPARTRIRLSERPTRIPTWWRKQERLSGFPGGNSLNYRISRFRN